MRQERGKVTVELDIKRKVGRPKQIPEDLGLLLKKTSDWVKWCDTLRELAYGIKDDKGKYIVRPSIQALELMQSVAYPIKLNTEDDSQIIDKIASGIASLSAPPVSNKDTNKAGE